MTYRELDVFRRSYSLAIKTHHLSAILVSKREFSIADQISRAARSIPSNIAEGFGRDKSKADTVNFLRDALGSDHEMLFNLEFMKDVGLLSSEEFQEFNAEYVIVGKELLDLVKKLNSLRTKTKAV